MVAIRFASSLGSWDREMELEAICCIACMLSHVQLFANFWTASSQVPLSMGILEWVAVSFFRGFSQPRDQTYSSHVSRIGRWILYHCATWEARFKQLVQFSRSVMSDSLRPHESQHARTPCPSPTPRVHPDSRPLSQWCHPAISSSVVPFSSCPQSLPASKSFPMSQLFAWGGQSIGVSASASVLPMNTKTGLL